MARSLSRVARIWNALAFVFTITVGLAVGCVWTVGEVLEDKLRHGKRDAIKRTHNPR